MSTTTLTPAGAGVSDHGLLSGLSDDDHLQYLLLAGRAGGQTANGGTVAGNRLILRGSASSPDTGIVEVQSPLNFTYDTFSNTTPVQQFMMTWNPTFSATGSYIGGALSVAPVVTISTGVFIPAAFSDTSNMQTAATPVFSAFTFINELAVIRNSGNFNLMSALVMNIGLTHERNSSGTSTTAGTTAISFAAQTRATVSGAVITKTTQVGLAMRPTFSTASGSTANLGIIIGLQMNNPAVALFQPQAGTETAVAIYGLVMNAMAFGGNITKAAVLCGLAAASNSYVILNTGTAQSDFGAGSAHWDDNAGIQLGGTSNATADVLMNWNGSALEWDPATGEDLRLTFAVGSHTFQSANFGSGSELRMGFDRFAFGQTGSVGNQVGVFVAPARTTSINGGWSDFLLTQAGNLTIDDTMSEVNAWTINAISLTSGTGSITGYVSTLTIGGMTTSGLGGAATHAIRHTGRRTGRGVDAFEPLTPAQLTADVNDYAPATGNSMRQVWRVDSDASRTITGIAVQQDDDCQWITNVGANNVVLAHQSGSSAAANRIISPTGANLTLAPDESALLWHDVTTDRWRILYHTGT